MKTKLEYLEAFDVAFCDLCGGRAVAARWAQGKWCNAHMFYGMGVDPIDGARRFFDSIMRYAQNRRELAQLRAAA